MWPFFFFPILHTSLFFDSALETTLEYCTRSIKGIVRNFVKESPTVIRDLPLFRTSPNPEEQTSGLSAHSRTQNQGTKRTCLAWHPPVFRKRFNMSSSVSSDLLAASWAYQQRSSHVSHSHEKFRSMRTSSQQIKVGNIQQFERYCMPLSFPDASSSKNRLRMPQRNRNGGPTEPKGCPKY